MNVISLLTPKSQVAYLYDDYTVRQGLEKLRAHGYTAIPVLSRNGAYVGTVSEGDFLWCILDREDNSLRTQEKLPLKAVMRKNFNPPVNIGVTMDLTILARPQTFSDIIGLRFWAMVELPTCFFLSNGSAASDISDLWRFLTSVPYLSSDVAIFANKQTNSVYLSLPTT